MTRMRMIEGREYPDPRAIALRENQSEAMINLLIEKVQADQKCSFAEALRIVTADERNRTLIFSVYGRCGSVVLTDDYSPSQSQAAHPRTVKKL